MDKGKLAEFNYKNSDDYKFSKYYEQNNIKNLLTYIKKDDCLIFKNYTEKNNVINFKKYEECKDIIKFIECVKSEEDNEFKINKII